MVAVVPRFAGGRQCQPDVVGAVFPADIRALAIKMRDRIDAPRRVMHGEDAHQPAPQSAVERAHPAGRQYAAQYGGYRDTEQHPERIQPVHSRDHWIAQQISGIPCRIGDCARKHPADMRMPDSAYPAEPFALVDMRRMRISRPITEFVMTAMVADPVDDRPFGRHRTHDDQQDLDDIASLEGAMGEQPVVTGGDAQHADKMHCKQQAERRHAHVRDTQQADCRNRAEERRDDRDPRDPALHLEQGRIRQGRLHLYGRCNGPGAIAGLFTG